jgi:L-rhamnose mutarotase
MKRYAMMIGLRSEHVVACKNYHTAVWPDVRQQSNAAAFANHDVDANAARWNS